MPKAILVPTQILSKNIDNSMAILRETFILLLPEVKHFIRERKRKSTETPKVMVSEIGLA